MARQREFAYIVIDLDFVQSLFLNYDTDKIDPFSSVVMDFDQMCIYFREDNRSIVPLLPLRMVTIVPMMF